MRILEREGGTVGKIYEDSWEEELSPILGFQWQGDNCLEFPSF